MIDLRYVQTMARYNCWQNQSIYGASDLLSDAERKQDRGAFFGSIHQTLCHLFWGDSIWMSRFRGGPPPEVSALNESHNMIADWGELKDRRGRLDSVILDWSETMTEDTLRGELTWYSSAIDKELTRPMDFLLLHFFNHQTHHRGQAHAMITAAGGKPDDTDLPFMPEQVEARTL